MAETEKSLRAAYEGKKVLVTGHSGFKGTWLVRTLLQLGAKVYGIGLQEGKDEVFELSQTSKDMISYIQDIRDALKTRELIKELDPQVIFHLAAQPLVLKSYEDPIETYASNVMGTAHVLDACRLCSSLKAMVFITTDKVYHNNEWAYPYRESDRLGGYDPYSASKAACEIIINSYRQSFFRAKKNGLVSLRAGNVIGGFDFAPNRIIPDIVRAIKDGRSVQLRSPHSVRPWMHVMDVLWGYLLAGEKLISEDETPSPSYNIAPFDSDGSHTVEFITQTFIATIGKGAYELIKNTAPHEMSMLRLEASLIHRELGWTPFYSTNEAIAQTAEEYKSWLAGSDVKNSLDAFISRYLQQR